MIQHILEPAEAHLEGIKLCGNDIAYVLAGVKLHNSFRCIGSRMCSRSPHTFSMPFLKFLGEGKADSLHWWRSPRRSSHFLFTGASPRPTFRFPTTQGARTGLPVLDLVGGDIVPRDYVILQGAGCVAADTLRERTRIFFLLRWLDVLSILE